MDAGETQPIYINGAEPDPNKSFTVAFGGSPMVTAGGSSTIEVVVTNLTTTATDLGDQVSVKIPATLNYVTGSSVALTPGTWAITDATVETVGNLKVLTWNLPTGLVQNEQAIFQFDISAPVLSCDVSEVAMSLATMTSNNVFCDNAAITCKIDIITSVNGEGIFDVPVGQSLLNYRASTVTSNCMSPTDESVTIDGVITNGNVDLTAPNFTVRYYFDQDGNGMYDATDPEIANVVESGPLAANATLPFSHSFTANAIQVCAIIARIDSTGLGLCDVEEQLLPATQLLNAGADTVVCATGPININMNLGNADCAAMTGYSYSWSAIAPANIADLSATNIAAPTLNTTHDGSTQDTLRYVLETTRPSCPAVSRDTIVIVRAIGVTVDGGSTVFVEPGNSVTLMPTVTGGVGPLTYSWSPTTGLDDPTIANPVATPTVDTDYTLTVRNAAGCEASAVVQVRVGLRCLPAEVNSITIVEPNCGESNGSAVINLTGNEADYSYQWIPDLGAAIGNGNGRTGLSFGGYTVIITDNAIADCSKRVDFIISNANGPSASVQSTTTATCASADGTASLTPAAFNYNWSDGGVGADRNNLSAGNYFVTFSDPGNVACQNVLEVSIAEDNPLAADVVVN
ncbi:MAG: hypothetical protein AAFO94_12185, partial [Bacteroidota bacterium]